MISVIIPIYNSENYLNRMFNCLNNQSFTDYEVLLINDGSTDDSLQICNEFARQKENVFVYTQNNSGVSSARNYGLSKAKGDYITFLDSDDMIPDNYLMALYRSLIDFDADISVCDVVIIKGSSEIRRFTDSPSILTSIQALNRVLSRKKINSGPYGKLFKRGVIQDIWFADLKTYEDILFVVDVFYNAKAVSVCNETEYQYMQNINSAMDNLHNNISEDIITASRRIIAFINVHPELSDECLYTTISHLYQYFEKAIEQKNIQFINNACKVFKENMLQILKSHAFHNKEKVVYFLAGFGYFYNGKDIMNMRKEML